jgi:hypothetical protein
MSDDFLQHYGVEFYSNEDDFDMRFNTFKSKYFASKKIINDLLTNYIIENRLHINDKNKSTFLNIHIIMNLVIIYHDYWYCNKKSLLLTAEEILEKYNQNHINGFNGLSNDEINLYISAFIFVSSNYSLMEYNDFIQNILDLSEYYESYCKNSNKNMIEMIEFEEAFDTLTL